MNFVTSRSELRFVRRTINSIKETSKFSTDASNSIISALENRYVLLDIQQVLPKIAICSILHSRKILGQAAKPLIQSVSIFSDSRACAR